MHRWIGWLFLLAGLVFISYPLIKKIEYDRQQQQLLRAFEKLGEMEQSNAHEEPVLELPAPQEELPNESQNVLLNGAKGILKIPKIDMDMVIFNGASQTELDKGAGMIEPQKEFMRHNIGLAGHRSVAKGRLFNRVGELREGDEIFVDTLQKTLRYKVTDIFVVHESEVSVLDNQDTPLLTLVTCTPLGKRNPPNRLIVQAELQKVEKR